MAFRERLKKRAGAGEKTPATAPLGKDQAAVGRLIEDLHRLDHEVAVERVEAVPRVERPRERVERPRKERRDDRDKLLTLLSQCYFLLSKFTTYQMFRGRAEKRTMDELLARVKAVLGM